MQHLAGHDVEQQESSSGPDPDPNKATLRIKNKHKKGDKAKGTAYIISLSPNYKQKSTPFFANFQN